MLTGLPPKNYKIVGIARFGTADNLAGASVVLFTMPAGAAHRRRGRQVRLHLDRRQARRVARPGRGQRARRRSRNTGYGKLDVVTGEKLIKENQSQIGKALGFLNKGLLIFGFVALVVGAFIIYNTFSIVVAQRTREMALLRAIGASRRQVLGSVIGESVVVGVVASAIGVVAGIGLAIGLRARDEARSASTSRDRAPSCRPTAVIIGHARRHHRHAALRDRAGTRRGARPAGRRDARRRRRTTDQPRRAASASASGSAPSASRSLLLGLFGGAGIWFVLLGAVLHVHRRLRARPAVRARSRARSIGAPHRAAQGHHRHARPRERRPQPASARR